LDRFLHPPFIYHKPLMMHELYPL